MRSLRTVYLVVLILVLTFVANVSVSGQEASTPTPVPIEISGVVTGINNGTITVAGLAVDVSNIALDINVTVGTTVSVTGFLLPTNIIVAQTVVVIVVPDGESTETLTPTTDPATPEVTASPTATPNPEIVIVVEGPVVNIINNIITIYDFDVEVEPQHPILTIIDIGDIVHVEGAFNNTGVVVASVVSNVTSVTTVATNTAATVALEGPVEAINGNTLVINGIPAQLAPNDPLLQTVQVGNFVSVQGNFEGSGSNIVLVVVNVTVINNVIIADQPFCWFHDGMGMGHWHCDGMGMGMGMGMGR